MKLASRLLVPDSNCKYKPAAAGYKPVAKALAPRCLISSSLIFISL